MAQLTLGIDDHLMATVRRYAAEAGTTVDAMVLEFLEAMARQKETARSARRRLRQLSESSPARLGERTWSRDDLCWRRPCRRDSASRAANER